MTKAEAIRLLNSERCSVMEIALAVDTHESNVRAFIRHGTWPKTAWCARNRRHVFNAWRGWPISDKVVSL